MTTWWSLMEKKYVLACIQIPYSRQIWTPRRVQLQKNIEIKPLQGNLTKAASCFLSIYVLLDSTCRCRVSVCAPSSKTCLLCLKPFEPAKHHLCPRTPLIFAALGEAQIAELLAEEEAWESRILGPVARRKVKPKPLCFVMFLWIFFVLYCFVFWWNVAIRLCLQVCNVSLMLSLFYKKCSKLNSSYTGVRPKLGSQAFGFLPRDLFMQTHVNQQTCMRLPWTCHLVALVFYFNFYILEATAQSKPSKALLDFGPTAKVSFAPVIANAMQLPPAVVVQFVDSPQELGREASEWFSMFWAFRCWWKHYSNSQKSDRVIRVSSTAYEEYMSQDPGNG